MDKNKGLKNSENYFNKSWELIKGIGVLVVLIPFLHYYLSQQWFKHFFYVYGIDMLPLINSNDISFTFITMNQWLISTGFIGFLWIAVFRLIMTDTYYYNVYNELKDEVKELKKNVELMKEAYLKSIYKPFFRFLFIFIIIGIFTFFILSFSSPKDIGLEMILWGLGLYVVLPFSYLIFNHKRAVILGFYIFFVFCWTNYALKQSIEFSKTDKHNYISFEFEGQYIESNDTLINIFNGYECTIMYDVRRLKHEIYPPIKELKRVKYKVHE